MYVEYSCITKLVSHQAIIVFRMSVLGGKSGGSTLGETRNLKAKKTHGFISCIVISVYLLDILSVKKATEYRNN